MISSFKIAPKDTLPLILCRTTSRHLKELLMDANRERSQLSSPKLANLSNKLSEDAVSIESPNMFKHNIEREWLHRVPPQLGEA